MFGTTVLLLSATSSKSSEVLRRFYDAEFLRDDVYAVFDSEEGDCINTARINNIPFDIAESPRDPIDAVRAIREDVGEIAYLISCGWGYKVPESVLDIPTEEALNCHSSFLPRYKGPSVYWKQWAHAERTGGATVHIMTEKFDEGPIVAQAKFDISFFDTPSDILHKASVLTPGLVLEALGALENGIEPKHHDGGEYYPYVRRRYLVPHAVVNHLFRAVGVDYRWRIDSQ